MASSFDPLSLNRGTTAIFKAEAKIYVFCKEYLIFFLMGILKGRPEDFLEFLLF